MKNVYFLLLFFAALSCKAQDGSPAKIGPEEFEKGITGKSVQVLDVRTSGEYYSGHIKNALQADWTKREQFNDRIQYVDKDKPVYIYCLVGGRSSAAAEWMRQNGFKNVIELEGGINAWKKASKPLEGKTDEPQLTKDKYDDLIPKNRTVLVDFGAAWCPPCVKMVPVLEELQNDKRLDFTFVKIDAAVHTELMKKMDIEPIPVFIIYKKGKEVWRKVGIATKEELAAQLK
ncbi:MAG: thioredoxin domain-containing protein [Chitinophagaceae bacterium]